jgi:Bacterial DNA-binding protein
MAPGTPKDPKKTAPKPKPAAKAAPKPGKAARAPAPRPVKTVAEPDAMPATVKVVKPVRAAKPALKVVGNDAPAKAAGMLKTKGLVEAVAAATGAKKPEARKMVSATLAAMGAALAQGNPLALPPLGKIRVAKTSGGTLTLKLRLADAPRGKGLALADDKEDD